MLEQVRQANVEVHAATRAQREARAVDKAAHGDADKELASKRCSGEEGRDWQTLQRRIDMNITTMSDILTGVDTSEEARRVRDHIQREALPRMRAQFAESMGSDDLAVQVQGLRDAQQGLAVALRSVQGPHEDR